MKGIILEKVGGAYSLVDNLDKPSPGKKQVLVKSLVTAINPVEPFMQSTGLLITSWPIVLGCDASGVVVEVGEGVTKFKEGDGIFGCTALGVPGHSTFQEYYLMDEDLAFKKPENITTEQAATIGVGLITAALGLIIGLKIDLNSREVKEDANWVILYGAAGSVGNFGIQLAKLAGYKVLAACSHQNNQLVKDAGADATFDYKLDPKEQLEEIQKLTTGNFSRVFDASAMAGENGIEALAQSKSPGTNHFATTNDWAPLEPKGNTEVYQITLGEIGRSGNEHIQKTNEDIAALIPKLERFIASGQIIPSEFVQIGDVGVGEVLKALDAFSTHKSGKKIIVRLAEN